MKYYGTKLSFIKILLKMILPQKPNFSDVGLTKNGIQEAQFSARKILKENITIDELYNMVN